MKIRVKTLDRGDCELEVPCDAKISELRKLIEDRMSVPVERQRLIFQGRPLLNDDSTLAQCGITDGLTLHMVERPANVGAAEGSDGGAAGGRGGRAARSGATSQSGGDGEGGDGEGDDGGRTPATHRAIMNVINGEMNLSRETLFDNIDNTIGLVRRALQGVLLNMNGITSSQIILQEDLPRIGDYTLQIHIRGSTTRRCDSAARSRLLSANNLLLRCETIIRLLDGNIVPYINTLSEGDGEIDGSDSAIVALDQTLLQLEEVMRVPQRVDDSSNGAESMETDESVPDASSHPQQSQQQSHPTASADTSAAPPASSTATTGAQTGDNNTQATFIVDHSNGSDYGNLLQRLLNLQTILSTHMNKYRTLLNSSTSLCKNAFSGHVLVIYQEHIQRLFHRIAHIYHSLSDLSMDFTSGVPSTNNLRPTETHFESNSGAEVILVMRFLSSQSGNRPGQQSTSRHEVINVTNLEDSSQPNVADGHSVSTTTTQSTPTTLPPILPTSTSSSTHNIGIRGGGGTMPMQMSMSVPNTVRHMPYHVQTFNNTHVVGHPPHAPGAPTPHVTLPPPRGALFTLATIPAAHFLHNNPNAQQQQQQQQSQSQSQPQQEQQQQRTTCSLGSTRPTVTIAHGTASTFSTNVRPNANAANATANTTDAASAATAAAAAANVVDFEQMFRQIFTNTFDDGNWTTIPYHAVATATPTQPQGPSPGAAAAAGALPPLVTVTATPNGGAATITTTRTTSGLPDELLARAHHHHTAAVAAAMGGVPPPSLAAFRAPAPPPPPPFPPSAIVRQVISRHAMDAALQAANNLVASSRDSGAGTGTGTGTGTANIYIRSTNNLNNNNSNTTSNNIGFGGASGITQRTPSNRESISWIRRAYANRSSPANTQQPTAAADHSSAIFIGPNFPHDSPIYTTDPHLPCQSHFCNPRANIRNSTDYENVLRTIREAVLRQQSNLANDSPVRQEADAINARWAKVMGGDESETESDSDEHQHHHGHHHDRNHIVLNQRGEAVFERDDHFTSVIEVMLRRAIANMADFDSNIARHIHANTPLFDSFNYSITPIVNSMAPIRAVGLQMPVIEVQSVAADIEIEPADGMDSQPAPSQHNQTSNSTQNQSAAAAAAATATGTADATDRSAVAQQQQPQNDAEGSESNIDILQMVRTLSTVMQSGRNVTLSEVMREMGRPVTHLESGFINLVLVMAYELLQISELLHMLSGDFSVIYNNRNRIRQFIIQNVFNDNSWPSQQDVESAAQRVSLSETELDRFLTYDGVHRYAQVPNIGRVDLIASVLRVERRSLIQMLNAFLVRDESMSAEEYSQRIVDTFVDYVQRIVVIANLSMTGAPFDYENILLRFMDQPSSGTDRQVIRWLSQMSLTHIRELLSRGTAFSVENMIDDFVEAPAESSSEEGGDASSNPSEPSQTEQVVGIARESARADANGSIDGAQASKPEASATSSSSTSRGGDNVVDEDVENAWRTVLPREWIPVIENDRRRLTQVNHPPSSALSDAYLCGSPIARKKAKKADRDGQSGYGTMANAVDTAFTEALMHVQQTVPRDITRDDYQSQLSEAAQEIFDEALVHRLNTDPDFEPEKFTELNKFLSDRNNQQK